MSQKKIPSNNPPANELASQSIQQPQPVCTWSAHALQSGSSPSPFPRSRHTLTATANTAGELFLFGGIAQGLSNSDLYVISTRDSSTTLLQTSGKVPTPRYGHGAALIGTNLLICGGMTEGGRELDHDLLHLLNLETREWSCVVVNGPGPGARSHYTTNVVGFKLFIFGGFRDEKAVDDMWALDLNSLKSQPVWESYKPTPGNEKPLPRWGHVSVTTGDQIIIFGGSPIQYGKSDCNDTWSFDISTREWTELHCTGSFPSPRSRHAAVLVDGVMYVFGGYSCGVFFDDLYALQLSTQQWFKIHNVGPSPHGRIDHAMASDETRVFVFGGFLPVGVRSDESSPFHTFDTKDIKYPEPEGNAAKPNENATQLLRKLSTGSSTQGQPQRSTSCSPDPHDASPLQMASPAVSGRPGSASPQITREQNPGQDGRPLENTALLDPEDGISEGSTEYHAKFSEPHSSSGGGVARLGLGQQLSVSVSVQTERDEEFVEMQARLRDMQAKLEELLLSRDQQIGQCERESEAVRLRLADAEKGWTSLDSLVVSRDQQVGQHEKELASVRAKLESELEAVRLRLADAEKGWTSLDELVVSHDQQVGQHEKELTDMRAKLEAKESELEAVRLRLTDAEKALTKGKAEADTLRAHNITDSRNRDEDRVIRGLMERMQVIEDEMARGSKGWNEKSIADMVCRNEE